ncbi:MAG TPA: acetyl-CoA carboxylase biotin carboxyl carrier protein [Phycisphaerales bacterium]|nr:acetyl-CoA carboxylase biotin carboxyl carrier protein [Phycisphaerales bacterium]
MSDKDHDIQRIQMLLDIMKANDLAELEIKHGDDKIVLRRQQPQPTIYAAQAMHPAAAAPAASVAGQNSAGGAAPPVEQNLVAITSPIVGTFYGTPSPDADPFVEVGTEVDSQTVVCIIEAMKVMNEIKAEVSGAIAEVCCTSGQAVEYGQVLFRVRPH